MQQLTKGQKLQEAYRIFLEPYSQHINYAVTLTLKQSAKIRVKRFNYGDEYYEYWRKLGEDEIRSTVRYFTVNLKSLLFGNYAKHPNKKDWAVPLVITAVEGINSNKQIHLHMAIGNIPLAHIRNIEHHIQAAFQRCDFANKQLCVKHVNNSMGWLSYITKEVGYTNNDALDIVESTIPPFIQSSICTESRLLTV
jgi:hypothetical protein